MSITITEFAKDSIIPKKVLRYLNRAGIIQDPLCAEDRIGLQFLEKVWSKKEVLRPQFTKLSMKARLSFIRTADLPTKWERYAYTRFRNQEEGKSLAMQTVVEEIGITFGFSLNNQQIERLYKIRNRAQVARHREKNLSKKQNEPLLQAQTNN
ncbi:MAG: hypothetical protein KKA54_01485 [Proteobacteria bacterium]|nr:hypothetical protein [Pseudomonadota bacterium]MBU0965027.1 hypothetical protein [Pseudomonadota bacterium]